MTISAYSGEIPVPGLFGIKSLPCITSPAFMSLVKTSERLASLRGTISHSSTVFSGFPKILFIQQNFQ